VILTPTRNRLGDLKLQKLVYIKVNLQLLQVDIEGPLAGDPGIFELDDVQTKVSSLWGYAQFDSKIATTRTCRSSINTR